MSIQETSANRTEQACLHLQGLSKRTPAAIMKIERVSKKYRANPIFVEKVLNLGSYKRKL